MPYTILLKRNSTPGVAPTPASLSLGELALNTGDGLLYYLDGSGSYSGTIRAINADTASFAATAAFALNGGGSGSGGTQEVSGVIGRFGIFSGSTFITGSTRLFVSNSLVQVSGGFGVSGNLFISGTSTQINGLTYVWPPAFGISGTVLSQNGSGQLAWVTINAPPSVSASYAETASYAFTAVSASWAPGGSGTPIAVDDEDVLITAAVTKFNFTGAGVSVTLSGSSTVDVTIPGSAGSLSRAQVSVETPTLTNNEIYTGSIGSFGKSFILFSVNVNTHSRVRLYSSQSFQIADRGRAIGVDPTGSEPGIIVDLVLSGSTSLFEFTLSPMVNGANLDPVVAAPIYYSATNLSGGSSTVSMSFNRLVLES
jgi:hypothetical protein